MRFLRAFAASLVLGWLALSAPALAAGEAATSTQCDCWCTSVTGAKKVGPSGSHTACSSTCKEKGEKIIVCSRKASELPANNLRCFDDAKSCEVNCAGPSLTEKQKASGYIYDKDYQPTECPTNSHYCYCTGSSYELAYKIPNVDPSKPPVGEVTDLGSYVNLVYGYLLGISGFVAIVMIMIGGLQYVTAVAGGDVKKAKERIKNAIIGLILLFSAALILQTVNPRLLTLQPPRLPATRRIELVDPNTSCEKLLEDKNGKYTLAGKPTNGTKCGSKDEVLKDRSGNAVAEGTVCTYRGCSDKAQSCVISGDKAECIACKAAVPTNETGLIPTSAVCSQLQAGMTPNHGTDHPYCFWTRDPSMLFGANAETLVAGITALGVGAATVVNPIAGAVVAGVTLSQTDTIKLRYGTCAELRVDCTAIAIANNNKTSCEAYNVSRLEAVNALTDNELYDLEPGWGDQDMKTICESNPCKWANGCTYDSEENRCRTAGSGVNLAECTVDSQCDNGTRCINKHCVRPSASGANGQVCDANKACNAGLSCVRSIGSGQGAGGITDICTDGQTNSPCSAAADCKTAGATCSNYVCLSSVSRANGQSCSSSFECQSNFCGGGICRLGTAGENCGVTGKSDSLCAPGFYCGGATGLYTCTAKLAAGSACTQNSQCMNGTCVGNNTDFVGSQGTCN